MAKKILITGGSGMIGSRLTELLIEQGHEVSHLGRSRDSALVPTYQWNVALGTMDSTALRGVDCIIHLAGAGVAERRWTNFRKKEILESRVNSTRMLCQELKNGGHRVSTLICASAIGFYGMDVGDHVSLETDKTGTGFLAAVVRDWEAEADKIVSTQIRVVKMRIGIPLSLKGGVLKAITTPIRFGFGSALGKGNQYLSWIHIDDLCRMFIQTVQDDSMQGVYNGVGVKPVTNRELTVTIAKVLRRPLWLPPVPAFALRIMLGEMAEIALASNRVSCDKICNTGFQFHFADLESALKDLFKIV